MARADKGIMKATLFIKNKNGISITEICVALCLVGIVAGVGLSSFKKTMRGADMSSLCDSARLFAVGAQTCITASGGWQIKKLKPDGSLPDCATEPTFCIKPCEATSKADLKKKLGFTCPVGIKDQNCSAVAAGGQYCLNMKKGKAQVIVHFDIDTREHKVYSGEPATFEAVNCVKSPTYTISKDEFCGTATGTTQGQTSGTTAGQTTTGKTSGSDPLGGNKPGTTD